jgi:hypothetical protein
MEKFLLTSTMYRLTVDAQMQLIGNYHRHPFWNLDIAVVSTPRSLNCPLDSLKYTSLYTDALCLQNLSRRHDDEFSALYL